jgi:hypothetical protein
MNLDNGVVVMKTALMVLGVLVGLLAIVVLVAILLTPWMDRWGTTAEDRSAAFPGDNLISSPARVINRSVIIQAAPEEIFPWILQIGADKSGMYSYTWLENLVGCKMAKVEAICPEWQSLQVGDEMKMCAGDFAPPPYQVAMILPDQEVVFGHQDNGQWVESWQFVLSPQPDATTKLVTRTSTNMTGGFWEIIRPITFIMERKMLLTIRALAPGTGS